MRVLMIACASIVMAACSPAPSPSVGNPAKKSVEPTRPVTGPMQGAAQGPNSVKDGASK
jgi:hypothetical protein